MEEKASVSPKVRLGEENRSYTTSYPFLYSSENNRGFLPAAKTRLRTDTGAEEKEKISAENAG